MEVPKAGENHNQHGSWQKLGPTQRDLESAVELSLISDRDQLLQRLENPSLTSRSDRENASRS